MQKIITIDTIGAAFRHTREEAGKSRAEAALYFRVSTKTIQRWESGHAIQAVHVIAQEWARWLDLPLDTFDEFTEEEPPGQGFRASRWNRIPSQAAA